MSKLNYYLRRFIQFLLNILNRLLGYRIWHKNQEPRIYFYDADKADREGYADVHEDEIPKPIRKLTINKYTPKKLNKLIDVWVDDIHFIATGKRKPKKFNKGKIIDRLEVK